MQNLDFWLFSQINNLAGKVTFLDSSMVLIAKYGALLYGLIIIFMFFKGKDLKIRQKNRKAAVKAVLSAIIALAINQIIGLFYFRPRPFTHHNVNLLIDKSPDPSFPSDHATGSSSLTFAVLKEDKKMGTLMTVLMILLIISRIYVGTHYPLDVIGGILTGFLGSYIIDKIWPYIDSKVTALFDFTELLLNRNKKAAKITK